MCFFFSSRRRHTIFSRDWSSDVCSSDLKHWRLAQRMSQLALALEAEISARHLSFLETGRALPSRDMRSEERRVGKEGRSRGGRSHYKKNINARSSSKRLSTRHMIRSRRT